MNKIILSVVFFVGSFATMAQVGFGTTTPEGALDVVSANKGLIVPRVANTTAVTNPVNGMIIYDLSSLCFKGYARGVWSDCFGQSAAAIAAAASDGVLAQIGSEADDPDTTNSETTIANFNAILPALTGVFSDKEVSYQNYIDGNPEAFSNPATQAEVQAMMTAISATDVVGSAGNIWMDRNLGATQVATSSTDAAAYGDLYQWGRGTDGHESRTSSTTSIKADNPGHGYFITSSSDWRVNPDNDLWQWWFSGTNNPCPAGYRIPTEAEWLGLEITNAATAFSSPLKLPKAGSRGSNFGMLYSEGTHSNYWSSSVMDEDALAFYFYDNGGAVMTRYPRAYGISVRCLKE